MDIFVYCLGLFIFYYPIIMSMFWCIGAIFFYLRREQSVDMRKPPKLTEHPLVSVLIPAHNEEGDIADTIAAIYRTKYPNLEVIVIDDASTDGTSKILHDLEKKYNNLRVLNLKVNLGKANGLNLAYAMSKGEIIMTIDADCLIDRDCITWLVHHFVTSPRVGAVTGNPRIRNRTSLLAKIQTAEYGSVIGLIKRTQAIIGKIMTVSGAIVAWRRSALVDSGLWSNEMITDDIAMTWKIEKSFWNVRYETNALCWILVPETWKGLWNQRKRWVQGGVEVVRKHRDIFKSYKQRRIWPIYLDYWLSIMWAHAFFLFILLGILHYLGIYENPLMYNGEFFDWNSSVIAFFCLIQFIVSIVLDSKYDKNLWSLYFYVIWYPVAYWIFNSLTVISVTWKALTKPLDKNATWVSPDRGIK